MSDTAEWPALRVGLLIVVALLALQLGIAASFELTHHDTTPRDLALHCLTEEKGIPVDPVVDDAIAQSAGGGVLRIVVEGNPVTLAFATSPGRAAEVISAYESAGEIAPGRLEARGEVVLLFDRPASPTQRQAIYDCVG